MADLFKIIPFDRPDLYSVLRGLPRNKFAVFVKPAADGSIPIVRSTRRSNHPAVVFTPTVDSLINSVKEVACIATAQFNNVLVKPLTPSSIFAPECALDLNTKSYICKVISYKFGKH